MPWVFDSMQEAGAFCRELFDVSGASPEVVSDALAEEIGFDEVSGRLYLRWALRRIVCDVA